MPREVRNGRDLPADVQAELAERDDRQEIRERLAAKTSGTVTREEFEDLKRLIGI